jgi:hypothetical protein
MPAIPASEYSPISVEDQDHGTPANRVSQRAASDPAQQDAGGDASGHGADRCATSFWPRVLAGQGAHLGAGARARTREQHSETEELWVRRQRCHDEAGGQARHLTGNEPVRAPPIHQWHQQHEPQQVPEKLRLQTPQSPPTRWSAHRLRRSSARAAARSSSTSPPPQ